MKLGRRESIVIAWAESPSGPGWANNVIWMVIRDGNGNFSLKALQPAEIPADAWALFQISKIVSQDMTAIVRRALGEAVR